MIFECEALAAERDRCNIQLRTLLEGQGMTLRSLCEQAETKSLCSYIHRCMDRVDETVSQVWAHNIIYFFVFHNELQIKDHANPATH